MKRGLLHIVAEIDKFSSESNLTELQAVEQLKDYYFNKVINENIKLYKKRTKKVAEITRDLKISHRKFYAILEKKNVSYTKYNKDKPEVE